MIKCACNDPKCKVGFDIDSTSHTILITTKTGAQQLVYLDANTLLNLIKELSLMFHNMVGGI